MNQHSSVTNLSTSGVPPAQTKPLSRRKVRLGLYSLAALLDIAAVAAGFLLAGAFRDHQWLSLNGYHVSFLTLPIFLIFSFQGETNSTEVLKSLSESVRKPLTAFAATFIVILLFTFFSQTSEDVSRVGIFAAFSAGAVFMVGGRLMLHQLVWKRWEGVVTDELLIIDGDFPAGLDIPEQTYQLHAQERGLSPNLNDPHILSELSSIVQPFDRVVIACSQGDRAAWALLLKGLDVGGEILVSDANDLGAIGISDFEGTDTLIVSRKPLSLANRIRKRVFDLAIAVPALIFLAPLMIAAAVAIRVESVGPIFFRQPRVGQGNRIFSILKFRSMRTEDCDADGAESTAHEDERITRVGQFIRRTSIDELPQLLNVISGQMSLVGPRPHALGSLAGDKLFWEVSEKYWLRHALKPGITGLAQVRGHRGATHRQEDLEARLQSDMEYLEGWRLWRDVTILFGTLRVLVHPKAF